jgi:hypothetical protein
MTAADAIEKPGAVRARRTAVVNTLHFLWGCVAIFVASG